MLGSARYPLCPKMWLLACATSLDQGKSFRHSLFSTNWVRFELSELSKLSFELLLLELLKLLLVLL